MSFAYTVRGTTPDLHIFMKNSALADNWPRTQSYDIGTKAWTTSIGTAVVTYERGLNVAGIGAWVIVTGGAYDAGATFTVPTYTQMFNADSKAWTTGLDANPAARDGAVCPVVRGSNFLIVGGTATGFNAAGDRGATTVQEWMLNTFTSRTAITGKRTEAGWGQSTATAALAAQYGFIAGGYARTSSVDSFLTSCYEWDANGGGWTSKTALTTGRFAGGCFTIDNETYLVGGGTATGEGASDAPEDDNSPGTVSWNRTRNTWVTRTDIPGSPRRSIGTGAINGLGYAAGGSSDGVGTTNYGYNMRYTPATDSWESDLQTYNTPANIVMRGCSA